VIDVLAIDRWSSRELGWVHRVSPGVKIVGVILVIAFLVVGHSAGALALVLGAVIAALLTSRLPVVPIAGMAVLPVTMSALFATTRLGGSWESAIVIVEKGTISSLTLLLLVSSTPRTDLFRALRRVAPSILADMVMLAYRSVFILIERALDTRDAVRLRSASLPPLARLRRSALVAALAILRSHELAEEQYAMMRLRGYPGAAPADARRPRLPRDAAFLLATGAWLAGALAVAPGLPLATNLAMAGAVVAGAGALRSRP